MFGVTSMMSLSARDIDNSYRFPAFAYKYRILVKRYNCPTGLLLVLLEEQSFYPFLYLFKHSRVTVHVLDKIYC